MNLAGQIKGINWLRMLLFYGILLAGTYIARKQPNFLNLLLEKITPIPFSFNYNHGIITLIAALLFYKFSGVKQHITLLGNNKLKSILFPLVLYICYTTYGVSNNHGVNSHLWAFLLCSFALAYNLMEEYAWRGYMIDSLDKMNLTFKSVISGICWCAWHLLIFSNFDQYGGFWIFLVFCVLFSFLLTYAVLRTRSLVVAAAIHAFVIQTNIVALICFITFIFLLFTWNKRR